MKTIIRLLFVLTIIISKQSNGQWTSSPPNLYTTTDNVGIGVSSPQNLVHIDGGTGTATYSQYTNGSTTGNGSSSTGFQVGIDGSGNAVFKSNLTGATMDFFTNGNNKRATITSGGNMGLNISSPNYLLHQDGGTGTATYHQFTNGSTTGTTSSDGMLIGTDGSANGIINMQEAKPINFSTSGSTRVTILGSGNTGYVGVGNTSPSSVLHIDGNGTPSTTGEVFRTDGPSATSQYWRMYQAGSLKGKLLYNNGAPGIELDADAGYLDLQATGGTSGNYVSLSTAGTTRMRVANGGNIAIGPGFGSPQSFRIL